MEALGWVVLRRHELVNKWGKGTPQPQKRESRDQAVRMCYVLNGA